MYYDLLVDYIFTSIQTVKMQLCKDNLLSIPILIKLHECGTIREVDVSFWTKKKVIDKNSYQNNKV